MVIMALLYIPDCIDIIALSDVEHQRTYFLHMTKLEATAND